MGAFACAGLDINSLVTGYNNYCTFVSPYILGESHYVTIFSLSPLANLSRNKRGTFPSGFPPSILSSSAQCTYKVKTFPYHGYYNTHNQRALHHTNIITVVNFLTLVLCSFGKHISLAINKSCQWLTFALKSFQQRLSCSRRFTVSVTMIDLLKLYLKRQKLKTTKRKTLSVISLHSFLLHMNRTWLSFHLCCSNFSIRCTVAQSPEVSSNSS